MIVLNVGVFVVCIAAALTVGYCAGRRHKK